MSINEDVVQYITSELIKRFGQQLQAQAPAKPRLCLVGDTARLSTPTLSELEKNFELLRFQNWDDPWPAEALVLITELGLQALVRVAEGDEGCTVEGRALLRALLNGQSVAALSDGLAWRAYEHSAPPKLLERYRRCEETLCGYGLRLVEEKELCSVFIGSQARLKAPDSPSKTVAAPLPPRRGGRRVWTEADIIKACPLSQGDGQQLRLEPGDLLTPLAQDYVKAMKIIVLRA